MRSFLLTLVFSTLLFECYGQKSWHHLPNIGLTVNPFRFDDIYFLNKNIGLAVDGYGWIHKTYNGGKSWQAKVSPSSDTISFRSIEFLEDAATGIAGSIFTGKVLRTIDTGNTWLDITQSVSDFGSSPRNICGLSH